MKVESTLSSGDNFVVQYYYPSQDKVSFISFFSEYYAKGTPLKYKAGVWRVKPTDK